MRYRDVVILIPSHSLEDFPTEQGDQPAAGLLNAFAVAWHPQLIAGAGQLPHWRRADDPPEPQPEQLVFVPEVCDGWLPHDWIDRARAAETTVVDRVADRDELLRRALQPLEPLTLPADLVADFLALGTCWLQVELLTRHMRNFGNIDEIRLQNRAVGAARAVLADDRETAEAHLRASFEIILEARERFYPVDCYLLDLCLLIPDVADDHFARMVHDTIPANVLVSAGDLETILHQRPELAEPLRAAVASGRICLVGGEQQEGALSLLPLESILREFHRGRATLERLAGQRPTVWGRRRFGLHPALPQLLNRLGYRGALHLALDDGIYPDAEHSRLRWQGADETIIDAFSRIPLAADGPGSYLRFPVRMAESMDHDHVAAIALARWPEVKAPWFDDLRRTQKYAPALGKFVTLQQLFETSGAPGRLCANPAGEYFSPYLIQHVARREADPLSRYASHTLRRRRFDAVNWCRAALQAVSLRAIEAPEASALEAAVEAAGPDQRQDTADVETQLAAAEQNWPAPFARLLGAAAGSGGFLAVNPCSFSRRATLALPELQSPPPLGGPIKAVDFDAENPARRHVTVDLPGCGFVWIPGDGRGVLPPPPKKSLPLAEWTVRNDLYEVAINATTGGVTSIRRVLHRENRCSQQLSYRFPRERTLRVGAGEDEHVVKTHYAEMRCGGKEVVSAQGAVVALATFGEILDQTNGEILARFRQTVRLFRQRPIVEIDVELSDVKVPDGDPWNNYFCSRFAWDDSAASVTRSQFDGAYGLGGERFESTDYIEAATESERLTIIPHGLPFHRKTGPRMVDALLVVAGESQRKFRFTLAIDQSYPLEAARDATTPVYVVPTTAPPTAAATSGWLWHLDARNVQLQRLLDVLDPPAAEASADEVATAWTGPGYALRLIETEGRARPVKLRCFRQPLAARKRDFDGRTLQELPLEGDAVLIDFQPYELADVELRFAAP